VNDFCVSSGNITILVKVPWQSREAFPSLFARNIKASSVQLKQIEGITKQNIIYASEDMRCCEVNVSSPIDSEGVLLHGITNTYENFFLFCLCKYLAE